ncbi:MAG: FtsK/SpoIIIE domain-containing protein [Gemmataceae bacterium]
MLKTLLRERLRSTLRLFVQLSEDRAEAETRIEEQHQKRVALAESAYEQSEDKIYERLNDTQAKAIQDFQAKSRTLQEQFDAERDETSNEWERKKEQANSKYHEGKDHLQSQRKENRWATDAVFEADHNVALEMKTKADRETNELVEQLDLIDGQARQLAAKWNLASYLDDEEKVPQPENYPDSASGLRQCVAAAEECASRMHNMFPPKLLKGFRLGILFGFMWLTSLVPTYLLVGARNDVYMWGVGLLGVHFFLGLFVWYLLRYALRTRFTHLYGVIQQVRADAQVHRKRQLQQAEAKYDQQVKMAEMKRDDAHTKSEERYQRKRREFKQATGDRLQQLKERYEPILAASQKQRDHELKQAEAEYQEKMAESSQRYELDLQAATARKDQLLEQSRLQYQTEWERLLVSWQQTLSQYSKDAGEILEEFHKAFPDWQEYKTTDWPAPTEVPKGMPFGTLQLGPKEIPFGIPVSKQLRHLAPPNLQFPALLGFPEHGSLLIKANGEGRARGVQVLQAVMLRSVTSLPAGKVRFTILDPVGLGENFAAFAHLADFDEKLIAGRIWTETGHIEKRLADLTEHIENVIQKYLRNQFNSLEEYNRQAGEIAEPYRILVIAHFPVNFSEEAARRLISIAHSGARCGIHTLVMVDTKQPLPRNFDLAELEQETTILEWHSDHFRWRDPDFGSYPLSLGVVPSPQQCTDLIKVVGQRARDAQRVEVPFETVAPPSDGWWTADSRDGLNVALGRAGATRKQLLDLGKGTSQHVLVAGKTGSGKSTLLHALILQLALHYSPEEVELYLVDFKKGVEFKTYANFELPHAQVIAIESEREFGLSVLQRLDAELKKRGDAFRNAGVNDLAGYRETTSKALPRVMLIVDEFQEFFVEDDRIAQETSLLLDRLVRQGRAFGIHILLGSQTLGGAYGLARSTMDQMAIRIALQCSETDGHLILNRENSAARLLSRPGEAIYNNASGQVEGNSPFQVVWLPDDLRESYLEQLSKRFLDQRGTVTTQVIFEGNAPARLHKNPRLHQLLEKGPGAWLAHANGDRDLSKDGTGESRPVAPLSEFPAWLGDAVAIKDPTTAVFRRQTGSNLVVVGQQSELALGVMHAALLSLVVVTSESDPRFFVVCDPSNEDGATPTLRDVTKLTPQTAQMVNWQELPDIMTTISEEVDRRINTRAHEPAPWFVFVHGLQRFRDLRRDEDDFGFSRDDAATSTTAQKFSKLLREGPAVGVFAILWCDSLNNLNRFLDRQVIRDLEMRVVFQMNTNDSTTLIDTPAATKLGLYRALFHVEAQGTTEKFRPYGLPPKEWILWVGQQLTNQSVSTES